MIIIGKEGCPKCKDLKASFSSVPYIQIPDTHIGFGDTICAITCFLGITPCHACRVRQSILNKLFPYFWNKKKIDTATIEIKQKILESGATQFPVIMDNSLSFVVPMEKFLETHRTSQRD